MYKFHLTPASAVAWLRFGSSAALTTEQRGAVTALLASLAVWLFCRMTVVSQLVCISSGSINKLISEHDGDTQGGFFARTEGESFRLIHTHYRQCDLSQC